MGRCLAVPDHDRVPDGQCSVIPDTAAIAEHMTAIQAASGAAAVGNGQRAVVDQYAAALPGGFVIQISVQTVSVQVDRNVLACRHDERGIRFL